MLVSPHAFTINGIRTANYGARDFRPDGSYVTTSWFVLVFVPIFPWKSRRILPTGNNRFYLVYYSQPYVVAEKLPLNWTQVLCVYGWYAALCVFSGRLWRGCGFLRFRRWGCCLCRGRCGEERRRGCGNRWSRRKRSWKARNRILARELVDALEAGDWIFGGARGLQSEQATGDAASFFSTSRVKARSFHRSAECRLGLFVGVRPVAEPAGYIQAKSTRMWPFCSYPATSFRLETRMRTVAGAEAESLSQLAVGSIEEVSVGLEFGISSVKTTGEEAAADGISPG